MRTVVLGPPPVELEALIARRRALGLDTHDELWEGEYHVAPAPTPAHAWLQTEVARHLHRLGAPLGLEVLGPINIGEPGNFRVPDLCLQRSLPRETFVPSAPMVVEILSPHDETWGKFDFYARYGVEEILVVSPDTSRLTWFRLVEGRYVEADHSSLLGRHSTGLAGEIRWPEPS